MLPGTYDPDAARGIRRDTLADALMELNDAHHKLQQMYVALDVIADDQERIWSDDERAEIRSLQRAVSTLMDVAQENKQDVKSEMENVK
jgi:hypothetical protein